MDKLLDGYMGETERARANWLTHRLYSGRTDAWSLMSSSFMRVKMANFQLSSIWVKLLQALPSFRSILTPTTPPHHAHTHTHTQCVICNCLYKVETNHKVFLFYLLGTNVAFPVSIYATEPLGSCRGGGKEPLECALSPLVPSSFLKHHSCTRQSLLYRGEEIQSKIQFRTVSRHLLTRGWLSSFNNMIITFAINCQSFSSYRFALLVTRQQKQQRECHLDPALDRICRPKATPSAESTHVAQKLSWQTKIASSRSSAVCVCFKF